MNTICKNILEEIKDTLHDEQCNKLINKIQAYGDSIENLNLDYLLTGRENRQEEVQGLPALANRVHDETPDHLQDFRIKRITLRNFRTFPDNEPNPYGISFVKKSGTEPCSLFLVGKNGTGKSTLFDALEWIYTGKVRNAENRGILTREGIKAYLTYGFGKINAVSTDSADLMISRVGVREETWRLTSTTPLCVPAICCSDMDIEEISKYGEDVVIGGNDPDKDNATKFQKFIRRQLGYDDLTTLLERLSAIGKVADDEAKRVEKRESLAFLSASDLRKIRKFLDTLCHGMEPADAKKYLKYADRRKVRRSSEYQNVQAIFRKNNYPFPELWAQLQQNWRLKNTLAQGQRGVGFLPGNAGGVNEGRPSLKEINTRINRGIDRLTAIHKRLLQAWNEAHRAEADDGYNEAITSLNKDAMFLDTRCDGLSDYYWELRSLQLKYARLGSSMVLLVQKLISKLAHLLDIQEGEDNYQTKVPNQLNRFVKKVLDYYAEKGENFEVISTSNSFEVIIHVRKKDGQQYDASPQKYLNTFRFRLYAVLLKIALAFFYMKENHCLAPIVIDDVFNASDFENSASLGDFIFRVYDAYQDVLGYQEPLQLIVFTHDEMIVNAFQNGLTMKSKEMQERERQGLADHEKYCIFGRLFPYWEAESVAKETEMTDFYHKQGLLNLYLEIGNR